jgi:hypothetical protein
MKISDLKVYITTSNDYIHVLKIFSHLFNKFWDPHQKVTVVGFDKYPDFDLPENFDFVSLGKQTVPYVDFCADMRKLIDIIEDDYFISFEENEFIIRPVNFKILESYQPHLNPQLGRVDFTRGVSTRPHTIIKKEKDYDIISSNPDAAYRIAMRAGIWNKSYLLSHCQQPITTYAFEHVATEKSRYDGFNIVSSSRDWAVKNMDGVKHTVGPFITNLRSLPPSRSHGIPVDEETILELIDLNFVQPLDNGLFRVIE